MNRDSERQKLFSRRAAMLAGGKVILLSTLAGRMYYLQVVESERYKTLADENRINLRLLPPPRGRIVDRHGRPMADNQQNYRVLAIPEQAGDLAETLKLLSNIVPMGSSDWRRILREAKRKRAFVPITVRENLSWSEVARIEVNTPDLPGVLIDVGQSRNYLHGEAAAHILGYVASVSEKELTGDPLLELPGFRIGKAGIEKIYDLELRGFGGSSQVEVNALGRVIRELARDEGQPGNELRLSIDVELQKFASERLGDESGAVVVMDVHSGGVLALASTPSYDPNAFNKGLNQDQWNKLISNKKSPLTNKAIAGEYAPGSTFKMTVALAALEKGAMTPETQVYCSGSTTLGNREFHCWKKGGHGTMNMKQALEQSCDVYFYETAKRTGIERIAAMARQMGFGQKLGIDLPGEHDGLVPSNRWKMATVGAPWQLGETLIAGIGQGFILATPLQLAVMTARLANGGYQVTPHMLSEPDPGGTDLMADLDPIGVAPEHLALVRAGMEAVVNSGSGTAYRSRITDPGKQMAGKTGTVQVRRITKAEREEGVIKNSQLPWKDRDHALFVGYAPIDNPRFSVSVVVEHGGGGSSVAAPIARDILHEVQRLDALKPTPGDLKAERSKENNPGDVGSGGGYVT